MKTRLTATKQLLENESFDSDSFALVSSIVAIRPGSMIKSLVHHSPVVILSSFELAARCSFLFIFFNCIFFVCFFVSIMKQKTS